MNSIGGYFELEMFKRKEYHANAIKLNNARNCFELLLRCKNVDTVFLPYYTCEPMTCSAKNLNIKYEYYYIDDNLEIINIDKYTNRGMLLYTNYFGIKNSYVDLLTKKYKNVIIDNAQAFYKKINKNINTFYSPRKFFGVPDGGYLYLNEECNIQFERDTSYNRFSHLLKRIDLSPESGFQDFVENDLSLFNQPILNMSRLTESILSSIDYEKVKLTRERNFFYLHDLLHEYNELKIDLASVCGPMVYPLLIKHETVRKNLIDNRIYVATYWKNVFEESEPDSKEYYLVKYLLPLPIDQRYSLDDMNTLYKRLKSML
jgi:hypothetical protein